METSSLVLAIVAAIVLVLGLAFIKSAVQGIDELAGREICRRSVQMHVSLHIKSYDPPASTIDCPPVYLEVDSKKVNYEYRDKKSSVKLSRNSEAASEDVKRAIANEIYFCWNNFLEGKEDLFGGPKKYCSVCSVITFKDKNAEVKDFYSYLMNAKVPNSLLAENGVTYFDYMQGYSKKNPIDPAIIRQNKQALEGTQIDPNHAYAVLFVYAKSEPFWDNAMSVLGKFWDSTSGKVAVIGGVLLFAGGVIVGLTGVGLPVGGAMMVAGVGLARQVVVSEGIEAGIDAYENADRVKDWTAFTLFGEYDSDTLKNLGCEDIGTIDKK